MHHGRPSPKKMLTEFDPVTLPTAESAYSEVCAAMTDAKVSGIDVPMATKVIAVIAGFIPATHPRTVATLPTIAVINPVHARAITKAGYPPHILTGGIVEKMIFHGIRPKWSKA